MLLQELTGWRYQVVFACWLVAAAVGGMGAYGYSVMKHKAEAKANMHRVQVMEARR